jgi:hypothetical protein
MLPAWDPHLLPKGQAANSVNGYLFSGALEGWRQPKLLRALLNSAAKYVYRIPTVAQSTATAYLIFLLNSSLNDQISIGGVTYTFVNIVKSPYDVLIGATSAITAANLFAAVTTDSGTSVNMGTLYGPNTVANINVSSSDGTQGTVNLGLGVMPFLFLPAPAAGVAYNTTVVTETTGTVRTIWLFNLLSLANTTATFQGGTNPSFSNLITAPATWLEFNDPDTNVVKSQVVDDQFGRFYFASPSLPPQYNTAARISAGSPPWLLGINPPSIAPTVSVAGGGNGATLPIADVTSSGGLAFINGNTVYLVPIVPPGAMQIQDVQFMPVSTDSSVQYAAVIYEDAGNGSLPATRPGNLLNTGVVGTGIIGATASSSQFLNPSSLLANTPYWIGIAINTSETLATGGGASSSYSFPNTFSNGAPGVAPIGTSGLVDFQMWAVLQTSDVIEARAYVYTWVSAYDEESAPSPPTLINGWSNGTWTIGVQPPLASDVGVNRNLTSLNLYRTVTGTGGSTVFYFVANLPVASTTYQDIVLDNVIALNIQLPSTNWFPPPENLQGLLNMPNGMVAGFVGNELWFCEPYFPHAWPPGYVLTTDFPIVGIGLTSGVVVACTEANSYVANGSSPGAMSLLKCAPPDPCLSRGSIVGMDIGVFYMSPNGLIQVTNVGVSSNVTELWITREKWAQLTPQKYGRSIPLASCYFCFGATSGTGATEDTSVAQTGFNIEMNQDNTSFTIWPQPGGHRVGFNNMTAPNGFNIDNVEIDPWTGIGMLVQNGGVYYYDFTDPAPVMVPYTYRTKTYQQNNKKSYEAMKVFFSVPAGTPTQNTTRNTAPFADPSWNTLGPNQYGIVRVFADNVLVTTREIWANGELLRIASGFKAEEWIWEFTGRVIISNVQVATTAKELANV